MALDRVDESALAQAVARGTATSSASVQEAPKGILASLGALVGSGASTSGKTVAAASAGVLGSEKNPFLRSSLNRRLRRRYGAPFARLGRHLLYLAVWELYWKIEVAWVRLF